jgi:yersiniabactin nonribosomal peptide synthetase
VSDLGFASATGAPTQVPMESARGLTLDAMRRDIAELLHTDATAVPEDEDLIRYGLDSVGIMRLSNRWRRYGIELKFADLFECARLARWYELARAQWPAPAPQGITDFDEFAPFDLAPMQQAYWVGSRERSIGPVHAQYYVEFDGEAVDLDRLQAAVHALVCRHPMLRARFLSEGRQQIMREPPPLRVMDYDLRNESQGERAERLLLLRDSLSHRPLRVEEGEVLNVTLSRLPDGHTRVHVSIAMLAADAQSFQTVLDELAVLYTGRAAALEPINYTFRRYLAARPARAEAHAAARTYWQGRIPELPRAPMLPLAVQYGQLGASRMRRRYFWMPAGDRNTLAQRCRDQALTLPMVLAAAFAEVIGAWCAEPQFLLNLPIFERNDVHPDVARVVGDFTNVLLLAVDLSESVPFQERGRALQAQLIEAAAHQEYSGLDVLREMAARRPGEWLAAPVVFTSAIGIGDLFGQSVRRCFGKPTWTISQTPQVWLDHQVTELDGGLLFNWDFVDAVLADGVVDAMFETYSASVKWLYAPGTTWADSIPVRLPADQERARASVNATTSEFSEHVLHMPFFSRARESPDAVALAWGAHQSRSYGELASDALAVAGLLRESGVSPGDVVAITMSRGVDQIASVLAVLGAGATFVPVSFEHPVQRRAKIYRDAGVKLVLTRRSERSSVEWPPELLVIEVESARQARPFEGPIAAAPESLAYIIYTSGSTGEPKGVEITHAAAMNTLSAINARFAVGSDDRVLAISSLDFDLSIYDIFGLLSVGGAVILLDETKRLEAEYWVQLAHAWRVTIWNSAPALLEMFLVAVESCGWPWSLRLVLVSGDWVAPQAAERVKMHAPDCRFVALGGATEAAIWSNAFEVDQVDASWRSVPYGFPLANQKFRIVSSNGTDCPDWVPGELWIGGKGTARGYRGDMDRTASRFIYDQGERWYRTGDRARYRPGGLLELLGRIDLQVKVKGHRIELGEVEAVLQSHPGVSRAVAVVVPNGAPRLGAVVVPASGELRISDLRFAACAKLPRFMVPDDIVVIDELPLTANGKVDRDAIVPLLKRPRMGRQDGHPRGRIEHELARMWTDLLEVDRIDRHDSFFAIGGTSLLATRLVAAIRTQFGIDVTLRQLLTSPTLAETAGLIEEAEAMLEEGLI